MMTVIEERRRWLMSRCYVMNTPALSECHTWRCQGLRHRHHHAIKALSLLIHGHMAWSLLLAGYDGDNTRMTHAAITRMAATPSNVSEPRGVSRPATRAHEMVTPVMFTAAMRHGEAITTRYDAGDVACRSYWCYYSIDGHTSMLLASFCRRSNGVALSRDKNTEYYVGSALRHMPPYVAYGAVIG